jgi:hypothetical protein
MDRYTRLRGGSELWTNKTIPSDIYNVSFWGSLGNVFWIKVAGAWRSCITWIKVSGVWKQSQVKIKNQGNWI